jgi:hypothetical protein
MLFIVEQRPFLHGAERHGLLDRAVRLNGMNSAGMPGLVDPAPFTVPMAKTVLAIDVAAVWNTQSLSSVPDARRHWRARW